ncbi:hypothetical protein AB833_07730 [Chromatiales bacterium (ex Bugula neritina AB1)]|nr:hypothetical protein AB833_07730 [Chromatiales bacterium (ex Bugula neritina AB1)]
MQEQPNTTAILEAETFATYLQLKTNAEYAATQLRQKGLVTGDRCVLSLPNSIVTASIILGVFSMGAIPVLVNEQAPDTHLSHAIQKTGSSVVISASSTTAISSIKSVLSDCVSMTKQQACPNRIEADLPLPGELSATETASILFTSGSTGWPKGVAQSHHTLIQASRCVAHSIGLKPTDKIICAIPWSFDYGFGQLLSTLLLGIPQILPAANDPFSVCRAIETQKPTVFAGVPSLFASLFRGVSPIRDTNCASIRLVTNTGSSIPASIREDLFHFFDASKFSFNYGLTETYRSTSLPWQLAKTDPDSVGSAIQGVTLQVLRNDGSPANVNETGEIIHSGVGTFQGYWSDSIITAKVRRPVVTQSKSGKSTEPAVYTGDLGALDHRGMLYISGRKDRQLKSMGVKVNPEEIERLLLDLPTVEDLAIVSTPHDIIGDMIVAVVVPKPDVKDTISELQKLAPRLLSPFMLPRKYITVEKLPRTATGKIDHATIRAMVSG